MEYKYVRPLPKRGRCSIKSVADMKQALSPWVALEYCADVTGVNDTYVCHAPESCGCDWPPSEELLVLAPRGCKEMGDDARVALYAGTALPPYVSLPNTVGGSTGYYSFVTTNGSTTWISTAVANCKRSPVLGMRHFRATLT